MVASRIAILDFLLNKQMHALVLIMRCFCDKKEKYKFRHGYTYLR